MHHLTTQYLQRAELWLLITTLVYFIMNGAQIFETVVIIPRWVANSPQSFRMLKDIDLKTFWIAMHSVHELTFMAAIAFCWQLEIRNALLLLFAIHFAVRVWTIAYFAPLIMRFQALDANDDSNTHWQTLATRWQRLNYLRIGVFIAVSVGVLLLYMQLINILPANF